MYDQGEPLAALGLAVSVYLVVHDPSKRDRCLLTQLGLRSKLRFVASAPPTDPENRARQTMLTMNKATMTAEGWVGSIVPLLDGGPHKLRLLQFPRWWETEMIYLDGAAKMNRKKLVFTLRSQEGGAHYDEKMLNPYYKKMSKAGLTTPIFLTEGKAPEPLLGAEYAMMRQIAWELTTTLDQNEIS